MSANPSSKMKEAKNQLLFSEPMILTGIISYSITLVNKYKAVLNLGSTQGTVPVSYLCHTRVVPVTSCYNFSRNCQCHHAKLLPMFVFMLPRYQCIIFVFWGTNKYQSIINRPKIWCVCVYLVEEEGLNKRAKVEGEIVCSYFFLFLKLFSPTWTQFFSGLILQKEHKQTDFL